MPDQADNQKKGAPDEFSIRDQMAGHSPWTAPPQRPKGEGPAPELARPAAAPHGADPIRRPGGAEAIMKSLDVQKLIKGVLRRKRLVIAVTLGFLALGVVGGIKAARVKYEARSSLLYRNERQQQLLSSSGSTFTMKGMSRLTAVSLIKRTSIMEQVVNTLNLGIDAEELKWRVDVKSEKNSQIVLLTISDFTDAATAVRVANEVAAMSIEDNAKFYRGQAASAAVQFQKQAEEARRELDESDRKIMEYQSKNRLLEPSADAKAFLDSITATSERLSNARVAYQSQLVRIQNYRMMVGSLSNEVLKESFEDNPLKRRMSNTEVALLEARTRFGPDNPRVKQLEDEIKEMRRMISDKSFDQTREQVYQPNPVKALFETELLRLEAEKTVLQQSVGQLEEELKATEQRYNYLPRQQMELASLQQKRLAVEELYKAMKKSEENAGMASRLDLADFEMLELARDAAAHRSVMAYALPVLTLVLGLLGGLVLTGLLEFLDPYLKTRRQVEGAYTVPLALLVPRREGLVSESGPVLFLPLCRQLYDRWRRWKGEAPCGSIAVTAAGTGEGKSALTYHMARYFTSLGVRTLILDFDAAGSSWLSSYGFKAGLESYLRGKAEWADLVVEVDGLAAMKVLSPTPDLLELLNTPAMARLWETARGRYSLIVVETPGLLSDEAAVFLAGLADRAVFAIGSPVSPKSVVDAAFTKLEEHHLRPSLLVLNMAPPEFCGKDNTVVPMES